MSRLIEFWGQIKARKIRKTAAIYTSTGLTVLGVENLLASVYHLPRPIFDTLFVLLLCGFPSACIAAWFHGAEGRRTIQKKEAVFYALSLLLAAFIIVEVVADSGPQLLPAKARSIAVLPFKNLSDKKEDEYFSDGVTEDIITQLSKIGTLQVISRTSVMKYKNTDKDLREIGRELHVATILEGSVRRDGGRVRIVGQLIDAGSDKHVWGDTYDRDMKDIFEIQSEVAQNIARSLEATLSPGELTQIKKKTTENLDAYALYLRGREYYYRYTSDDNDRAIDLFRKALALDPHYALAFAGLGDAYDRKAWRDSPEGWGDSALAASTMAVSLDPTLPDGYKALGATFHSRGEYRRALELYHTAVKLNPNYAAAVTNIGAVNLRLGELDEAVRWFRKAVTLQPGFARWSSNLGVSYFSLGYDSAATTCFDLAIELQPDFVLPYVVLSYIYTYAGRTNKARENITRALLIASNEPDVLNAAGDLDLVAGNTNEAKAYYEKSADIAGTVSAAGVKLAYVLQKMGNEKQSSSILDANIAAFAGSFDELSEGAQSPYYMAGAYSVRGDTVQALRWLRKAIELGYRDRRLIWVDPLLENLRGTSGCKQLLSELDIRINGMRARVEQLGVSN